MKTVAIESYKRQELGSHKNGSSLWFFTRVGKKNVLPWAFCG